MIANPVMTLQYLVLLLVSFKIASSTTAATSKIEEVMIYGGVAEVTRTFSVTELPEGYSRILLSNIPSSSLEESTIRISGSGSATLLSTIVENNKILRDSNTEYITLTKKLSEKYNHYKYLLSQVTSSHDRLKQRGVSVRAYVNTLLSTPPSKDIAPLSIESVEKILNFEDSENIKMNEELNQLNIQILNLNDKITKISDSLQTLQNYGYYIVPFDTLCDDKDIEEDNNKLILCNGNKYFDEKSVKTIILHVYNPPTSVNKNNKDNDHTIKVTYMINNAYWQPSYDLYIDNNLDPNSSEEYSLKLDMYASITQNTNEDWESVQLSLSTSMPYSRYDMNSPVPYQNEISYVNYYGDGMASMESMPVGRSSKIRSSAKSNRASMSMMAESLAADTSMVLESGEVSGSISGDLGTSYVFNVFHPVNVPCQKSQEEKSVVQSFTSSSPSKLFIDTLTITSDIYTYAVPTSKSMSYLKSWGNYTGGTLKFPDASVSLLGGPSTRLFIQGLYTGELSLPEVQPGNNLKLSLGQDKQVSVKVTNSLPTKKHEEVKISTPSSWLTMIGVGKSGEKIKLNVKEVEYFFTVKNTHKKMHLVILSECIPHSTEEDVKVELLSPSQSDLKQKGESDIVSIHDIVYINSGNIMSGGTEEELLEQVLNHDIIKKGGKKGVHVITDPTVFMWKKEDGSNSNNIIWAQWMSPG